jgi:hypothetical protein
LRQHRQGRTSLQPSASGGEKRRRRGWCATTSNTRGPRRWCTGMRPSATPGAHCRADRGGRVLRRSSRPRRGRPKTSSGGRRLLPLSYRERLSTWCVRRTGADDEGEGWTLRTPEEGTSGGGWRTTSAKDGRCGGEGGWQPRQRGRSRLPPSPRGGCTKMERRAGFGFGAGKWSSVGAADAGRGEEGC